LEILETGEIHEVVIMDGFGIGDECCLIARTPRYVIG
jgi:hypothetical protein